MAKKEKMSTEAKAKAARAKASGKVTIKTIKKVGSIEGLSKKPSDKKYSRKASVLDTAKKLTPTKAKQFYYGGPNMVTEASVKKVDSDAYNVLSKLAKGKALKGAEAEAVIQKAYKTVSTRMANERNRTASRGEMIARREKKKRMNTELT